MKVLAINGSARKDGNTALLINTDYEKSGSEYGVFAESAGRKAGWMMRRTVGLLLSFAMIFSLAACSRADASERQGEQSDSVSVQPDGAQDSAGDDIADMAEQSDEQRNMTEDTEQETEGQGAGEQEAGMDRKALVVYFSCTGTTKQLAEYAAEILGADIYEIVAEEPYTEADLAYYTGGRADQEQNDPNARPAIAGNVEDMDGYDIVLIGYPIWLAYHNLIQCTQA